MTVNNAEQTEKIVVPVHVWRRINDALNDALENSKELLNANVSNNPDYQESKKDKVLRLIYEREVAELEELIEYSNW